MTKRARFILLDPAVADHAALASDPPAMLLWIWLLCKAHAREGTYVHKLRDGNQVELNRGQVFIALRAWAKAAGVGHAVARRVLVKLAAANMVELEHLKTSTPFSTPPISQSSTPQRASIGTRVTIRNYAIYQGLEGYGAKEKHTPTKPDQHTLQHTPNFRDQQQTKPELPKQNHPAAADDAKALADFLREQTGVAVGVVLLHKLAEKHGWAKVAGEAEYRAQAGAKAFAGVASPDKVFAAAVARGEHPETLGLFLRWKSAKAREEAPPARLEIIANTVTPEAKEHFQRWKDGPGARYEHASAAARMAAYDQYCANEQTGVPA